MTDTPKPLVPLYPYQCPECEGEGFRQYPPGALNSPTCANCKGSGMVWLPTPHPAQDIQEIVEKVVRRIVPESFAIPYNNYTYDTLPDGSMIAIPANHDEPYTKGGD